MKVFPDFNAFAGKNMTLYTAELILAELHQQLLIKEENHSLTAIDRQWLKHTDFAYGKHQADINVTKMKQSISISRLTDKPYVSIITGEPLTQKVVDEALNTVHIQAYCQKKLDKSK